MGYNLESVDVLHYLMLKNIRQIFSACHVDDCAVWFKIEPDTACPLPFLGEALDISSTDALCASYIFIIKCLNDRVSSIVGMKLSTAHMDGAQWLDLYREKVKRIRLLKPREWDQSRIICAYAVQFCYLMSSRLSRLGECESSSRRWVHYEDETLMHEACSCKAGREGCVLRPPFRVHGCSSFISNDFRIQDYIISAPSDAVGQDTMANSADIVDRPVFKYSPLEPNSIRLIEVLPESTATDIRCTLHHCRLDLEDGKAWTALSYCWGNPSRVACITLNGGRLGIARNLLDFFQALVQSPREHASYWIDAICINQEDIPERSAQVQEMWRVYGGASQVLSWLGPSDVNITRAFAVLRRSLNMKEPKIRLRTRIRRAFRGEADREETLPEFTDAVATVFRADYFGRVWIMPELMNAKDIVLMSGTGVLSWEFIHTATGPRVLTDQYPFYALVHLERLNLRSKEPENANFDTPLLSILKSVLEKSCADPRDRVFSLMAYPLMRRRDSVGHLQADYTMSPEEVCVMTLPWYDRLSIQVQPHYYPAVLLGTLVSDVVPMSCDMLGLADPFQFQAWLRSHVRQGSLRTTSGKLLDCSGCIIQDLLGDGVVLHKPDNWRKLFHARRTEDLHSRGLLPDDSTDPQADSLPGQDRRDQESAALLKHLESRREGSWFV